MRNWLRGWGWPIIIISIVITGLVFLVIQIEKDNKPSIWQSTIVIVHGKDTTYLKVVRLAAEKYYYLPVKKVDEKVSVYEVKYKEQIAE
jgi:hypothetical protein